MTKYSKGLEANQTEGLAVSEPYAGDSASQGDVPAQNKHQLFSNDNFKEDLKYWQKKCPTKFERIKKLTQAITHNPFNGEGHPKPLKYIMYQGHKVWSRKIDDKHRLLYTVTADTVYFLQARHHYNDK